MTAFIDRLGIRSGIVWIAGMLAGQMMMALAMIEGPWSAMPPMPIKLVIIVCVTVLLNAYVAIVLFRE